MEEQEATRSENARLKESAQSLRNELDESRVCAPDQRSHLLLISEREQEQKRSELAKKEVEIRERECLNQQRQQELTARESKLELQSKYINGQMEKLV